MKIWRGPHAKGARWAVVGPRWRRVLAGCAVCVLALPACDSSDNEGSDPSSDPSAAVAQALARPLKADARLGDIQAILVLHDGEMVFEKYYDATAEDYADIRSVTKSVMSTLVGIAIEEGAIPGVGATLAELLPTYRDVMTDQVAGTTLDQVLTMTAGFTGDDFGAWVFAPDTVRKILSTPVRAPGVRFEYSDATAHLLTAILEQATGTDLVDYARQHLFDPLGIEFDNPFQPQALPRNYPAYTDAGPAWAVDAQGRNIGAALLKMRPTDMAKIGQLFLDEGEWEGQQVVPAEWVATATTTHVEYASGPDRDYGYMWWVGEVDGDPAFLASGYGGQAIRVIPDRDLVVVTAVRLPDLDSIGASPSSVLHLTDEAIAPLFR